MATFSRQSLSHREKRKHTKRAILCIVFLFFFLFFRVVFNFGKRSSKGDNSTTNTDENRCTRSERTISTINLRKSPHEYALSMAKNGDTSGGVSLEDRNAEDDVTQQEEEQKQFSLANTKIYVLVPREFRKSQS